MGFSRRRQRVSGPRWTAYFESYDGTIRSAGTFASEDQADLAWLGREQAIGKGVRLDPSRARMSFKDFAENIFLPHHVVSPARTRELGYCIRGRLNPIFGDLALADITRERIRAWVAIEAARHKPATVRSWKVNLTTILNTAVALDYLAANPALGVKPPKEPPSRVKVIDHDEYARIRAALPGPVSRLIVEVGIETGLRWGELSELRVRDIRDHRGQPYLEVCRAVSSVGADISGAGRFLVRDMTKGGTHRNVSLRPGIADLLGKHIAEHGLGDDDLLFSYPLLMTEVRAIKAARRADVLARPIPEGLGRTEPNDSGRTWRHGTLNAYVQAKCRCEWCRHRMAQWSATRVNTNPPRTTAFGKRSCNTTGHIGGDTFRSLIWKPTLDALGYPDAERPTFHKLRHAHASWLLAGGADVVVVMARLGHKNLATTQRYLHALDPVDETALGALDSFEASRGDELARRRRRQGA